jgi:hypothetical protein
MAADDKYESPVFKRLCLRVTAEADPSVLARLLGHFQHLNLTPRRVVAEYGMAAGAPTMHVQVEVCGLTEDRLALIAAKIAQLVPVLHTYWHHA